MSNVTLPLNQTAIDYALSFGLSELPVLKALRETTEKEHPFPQMMTRPEQAQFIAFLLRLMNAKRVLEVGVFTGYTTLAMALALPEHGEVIACDRNAAWTSVGVPYWESAGVAEKISLCLEDAQITLQVLLDEGQAGTFDFVYIDADKIHYPIYFELAAQLVRPGGVLAFDDVLRIGAHSVAQADIPGARVLRELNAKITADSRFNAVTLPLCDGVLLAQRIVGQ